MSKVRALKAVAGAAIVTTAWGLAAVFIVGLMMSCSAVNPYFEAGKPHHKPDGFTNTYGPAGGKPLKELLTWFSDRAREGLPKAPDTLFANYRFPVQQPDLDLLKSNRSAVTATWVGHATVFMQIGGLNILTDPHFSERTFMVQFAGPKRRAPLPVTLQDLPAIDLVLISHNHYDHLDRSTVQALLKQSPQPLFVAPLGIDLWLRNEGAQRVERFDWWDERSLLGATVTFVPAQHWSSRSPFDRNKTLWGGWVVRKDDFSFYFAGDSGYSKDFADIGKKFGGFDFSLIPVGAYEPRWFMKDQHVNPMEAVQAHRDVGSRLTMGIHWGTFELTDEPLDQPVADLADALKAQAVPPDRFVLFQHGETRILRPAR
jgi:L-ascorbate metabolism protein UlaG (beta-lactamase superfamily)